MSRSHRYRPNAGCRATVLSDKKDKSQFNRKSRRILRHAIQADCFRDLMPYPKFADSSEMAKGGHCYFGGHIKEKIWMRK